MTFQQSVCFMFLSLGRNLVLCYELDKKWRDILLYFPIPGHAKRKPTFRPRVWWLAKLAWYDVAWKPSKEDLHDVVRTYTRTILPRSLVSILYGVLWRKTKNLLFLLIYSIRRRSDYIIGFITPAIGPNKSKKLTRPIVPTHNLRGKVWMEDSYLLYTWLHRQLTCCLWSHVCCFSFKLCRVYCVPAL